MSEQQQAEVIPIDKAQRAGARFTISATLEGFAVDISFEGKIESLAAAVQKLKSIGAVPAQQAKASAPAGGTPLCPAHQKPMKASRQPGKWFCAQKRDDGEYCQEKA